MVIAAQPETVIDTAVAVSAAPDAGEWNAYVESCADATGYHLWGWRHVFERALGHRTAYLAARRDGRITGVLPLVVFDHWLFGRFGVSLPFINYGGVLADDDASGRALLDAALALARDEKLDHVELRHQARRFDVPVKQHKVSMRLALAADETAQWEQLDRKIRNQVRKAEKSNLTPHEGSAELLGEFYEVFSRNMRDLGSPVVSPRLFSELAAQFPDRVRVFVVRDGGKPVAGSVTYGFRSMLEVPWASSLREYRASAPNMLLYWRMIRHAVTSGYRVFDFGRSTPGEGTFHFKRQWGAVAEPLFWEYGLLSRAELPDISPKNGRFAAAIRAWQHVPLWMTRLIGPAIVRNLPA